MPLCLKFNRRSALTSISIVFVWWISTLFTVCISMLQYVSNGPEFSHRPNPYSPQNTVTNDRHTDHQLWSLCIASLCNNAAFSLSSRPVQAFPWRLLAVLEVPSTRRFLPFLPIPSGHMKLETIPTLPTLSAEGPYEQSGIFGPWNLWSHRRPFRRTFLTFFYHLGLITSWRRNGDHRVWYEYIYLLQKLNILSRLLL